MIRSVVRLFPSSSVLLLGACVAPNTLGFFTTDNFGINITPTPDATVEIAYSRKEGVIEPAYGRGAVPAVAAVS